MKLRSIRLALEMTKRGIKKGDIITVCTVNTLNSQIPVFASLFLGVTVSCLDPSLSEIDSSHLINLVNPKMIFACADGKKLVDAVLSKNTNLKCQVVLLEGEDFAEYQKETVGEKEFLPVAVEAQKTVAFIMFSSGTTGLPKGIELTHYGIDYGAAVMRFAGIKGDAILHFSSLYWVSAVFLMTLKFQSGGRTVVCRQFNPDTVFKTLSECKVTYAFIASNFSYSMTGHPDAKKYDYSHVHCLTFSGSILSREQVENIKNIFTETYVTTGYGMTELASFGTLFKMGVEDHLMETRRRSAGTPCHGFTFKICDEDGKILGPNEQGEIRIKTKTIMAGYHKIPTNVFDSDGFICSGDVGYFDEDGCIYIVDRLKDMFKYKDWHMVPASLEGILLQHAGISDAVVFGTPHPQDGDLPTAAVVLKGGYSHLTEEEICDFVAEKVSDRQRLRGGIKFIDMMPRTPTGKVLRRKVREMFVVKK